MADESVVDQPIESPVEATTEAPQPPKYKLWKALSSSSYYTKPYADFDKQFSTPEQINKLHGTLSQAQYYTKSADDFNAQFFAPEKKSPVGNVLSNGSNFLQNGGITDPNSAKPYSGITTTPQMQQQLVAQDAQNIKGEQERQQALDKQSGELIKDPSFSLNLKHSSDIYNQRLQAQLNDPNSAYYQSKRDQQSERDAADSKLNITLGDRVAAASNSIYRGSGDMLKGAVRAANAIVQKVVPEERSWDYNHALNNLTGLIDKGVDWAKDYHGLSEEKEAAINRGPINGMINGLAEFAPAIATAERTGGMSFFVNDYEKGYENIDKMSKETGANLSENQKQAFSIVNGAASALLMTHNLHSLMGNLGEKGTDALLNRVTTSAIEDIAKSGEDFSADNVKKAVLSKFDLAENKVKNFGMSAIKGTAMSTGDLSALESVKIGTEHLVNTATGKKVFDDSNDTERMHSAMQGGAMLGLAASVAKAPLMLAKGSQERNSVIESLYKDPSKENVDAIKGLVDQHFSEKGLTPDEIKDTHQTVDELHNVVKTLPKGLAPEKQIKVSDFILQRKTLEDGLKSAKEEQSGLDPAFTQGAGNDDVITQHKIDSINDQIKAIATDTPIKYFRGEDGQPMKQVGDTEPEKIDENRYLIEKPNSLFKAKQNEQTAPNQEVPIKQPANETGQTQETVAPVNEGVENNLTINPNSNEKVNETNGTEASIKGSEETVPTEKEVVKSGAAETKPEITVNEVKDKPITYKGEPAEIIQDGQTLVAKIKGSNREYELGNVDEVGDKSIKELGIEHENSVVDTHENGNVIVRDKEYVNNYSDPKSAINYDKNGNVVSVNLETPDGAKRTFKGDVAEDIAYQIHLKELNKNNESKQQFEQFVEQHEPSKSAIVAGENEVATEKATVKDNATVSRKPAVRKPKVKEETKDATKEIGKQESSKPKRPEGDKSRKTDKASSSDSPVSAKKGKGKGKEKLTPLPLAEHSELNNILRADHGISIKDLKDEYAQRNEVSESPAETTVDEKTVQPAKIDSTGNDGEHRQGGSYEKGKGGTVGSESKGQDKSTKLGDPLRKLADKIDAGKINKLGGFRASTGFDGVWDTSLSVVSASLRGGAKIADAIELGLKHVRETDWYKNLTDKKDFENKYKEHLISELVESKEPIGITREETKKQREIRGLEDLPEAERVTLSEMFDNGKKAVDDNEVDPTQLAIEVAEKPRNLSNTEVNALLYDRQNIREQLEDIRNKIDKKIAQEDSISETNEILQARQRFLESQLDTNERAIRSGARENSLALNAMKNMINSDYTLATQRARMRAAAGGELTPAMEAELEKYKTERDQAIKRLEDYEIAQQDKELHKEIQRQIRAKTKAVSKEALKAERHAIVEDFRAALKKMRQSGELNSASKAVAQFLQAATPYMRKMLTNLIKEGIVEAKDIVDAIRDEFKDDIEGLTDRDIIDALSGKYVKKVETKNELVEQRQTVSRILNLTAKLEDLQGRKIPEKSERKQVQRNKEIERLEEEIKAEKKKISFETAEDRSKESLKKRLDKINERIKNQDFSKGQSRADIKPDAEHITLQSKVKKAENNFDAMAERLHMHQQTGLEKTLTTIQQIRRAMLLSGMKTLAKLYSFAAARSVSTPMEELVTSLNTHLPGLRKIAEQSPRFSTGFNAKAEAQAITTRWSKATLGDSWKDVLSSGVGELDRLYGKNGVDKDFDLNPSALEFFGRLHGAFKNSTKRAEFFRSFQKRLEYAAKQGQDINDPNVQFVTGLEAYADGKRAILMNDNLLVDKGYKSLLRGLEQGDKTNKNNTGKIMAAVIRGLFPIVKIPTNYVLESLDVATFGVRAIPNLIKAMTKGADSLSPKEADMVMRTLAKGQIGLALMIIAYNNPQMFGGYYSGQRKNNDLGSGEIKMFGYVLPHFLSHNPYFEAMQIAATLRRAVDLANRTHGKEGGVSTGAKEAAKGLTEQIPFTGLDVFGDSGNKKSTAGDVAGKAVKNLIEPRLIQEVAEVTDKKTDNKHKRAPSGFVQQLKSGLPILREQVPIKKKKKY